MTPDRMVSGAVAQRHLLAGMDALADVLAVTLGPVGRSVVVEHDLTHKPEILESAAEIARRMTSLSASHQNPGAMLLRHVVWRVVSQTGDGGATAAVFARALYRDALRLATAGISPLALAAGMEAASDAVICALHQQARRAETEDDLARMALSLVGEKPLAAVLGEMRYLLGKDASITVEKYVSPTIDRVYVSGSAYPARIVSPQFYTQPAKKQATAAQTSVALVDDSIQTAEDAAALLQAAIQAGKKSLTIVTSKPIAEKALAVLGVNHRNPAVPLAVIPVQLTGALDAHPQLLADVALFTGAAVLNAAAGQPTASVRADMLGAAVWVDATDERIVLEAPHNDAVRRAIEDLRQRIDASDDESQRERLQQRLAALTGGVGILRVGGFSDQERAVRAKSAERALAALASAQVGGVVAGGGAALVHAGAALDALRMSDPDEQHGVKLFARASAAPLLQILHNAGIDAPGVVLHRVSAAGHPATYDVVAGQMVDAYASGIVTPLPTLEAVVRLATSGIGMALSSETILYHHAAAAVEHLEP